MTAILATPPAKTVEVEVGPCGCPACEKWADCDYCGGCNPISPVEGVTAPVETSTVSDDHLTLAEILWGEDDAPGDDPTEW